MQHRRRRHTAVVYREHRLFEERHSLKESPETIRLMMLRDQIDDLVGIMRQHREAVCIAGELLKDEHVGVGAIAADVLKAAIASGVDISRAEGPLREALCDRYAKKNAAGALALLYVKRGDILALERLLRHSDQSVRDAAGEACTDGAGEGPKE